jgi:hypothetical protein
MPHKDLEVQLVEKLGPHVCIIQEQFPGVRAQALSQMSVHWHSPCQRVDGKLAGANKAKAASQPDSPMLGMSLTRLSFCKGTAAL